MLKNIKQQLIDNPEAIINVLEAYDFYKPHIMRDEIRCGLYEGSNTTAIRIKLKDNKNLFVTDYSRDVSLDLIQYIIKIKSVEYKDVIHTIKKELGVDDLYFSDTSRKVFGGFYDKIRKKQSDLYIQTYPESVLNNYCKVCNVRFLRDNISLETQKYFNIGYDVISQRITIPIYTPYGELCGVKGRANWEVSDEEPKYLYLIPCPMSSTLYGYSQNYQYLQNNDVFIVEAEKSVMQAHSYGLYNFVALGSHSLSPTQCKLIMSLQPKRIIFMLDKDLEISYTYTNIKQLQPFMKMSDVEVLYWKWNMSLLPDKASPTDYGNNELSSIIKNELCVFNKEDVVLSKSCGISNQTAEDYLTLTL